MDYRKIIIVGETNIGRSFMAECILRGILQKRNCQNIEVVSRGLVVLFSEPVAPGAAKILREKGYSIENFRSAQLTEEDLASADLVLTITKGLAEQIKESFDVQTASYMPYFISMVVAAGMVVSFIEKDGLVNQIITLLGGDPVSFRTDPKWFPVVYTVTNIWKSFGWNSILYLSAMASIDPALYESARLDGANRWQQALHITLPMIAPTIAIMLIFAVGDIMSSNTDLILLLYNNATMKTADVFGTYVYREGLLTGKTSLGTAIGLFASTVNLILVFIANKCSNKISGDGLF